MTHRRRSNLDNTSELAVPCAPWRRRLSQVVRRRSAKPLYGGSNPPAASTANQIDRAQVDFFVSCCPWLTLYAISGILSELDSTSRRAGNGLISLPGVSSITLPAQSEFPGGEDYE